MFSKIIQKLTKMFQKEEKANLTIAATVYRANGKVEDLGVISKGTFSIKAEAK